MKVPASNVKCNCIHDLVFWIVSIIWKLAVYELTVSRFGLVSGTSTLDPKVVGSYPNLNVYRIPGIIGFFNLESLRLKTIKENIVRKPMA